MTLKFNITCVAIGSEKLNNKTLCSYGLPQRTLINNGAAVGRERMLTQ